ncbi:MAG: hypothetical protein HYT80_04130 [Euryarchaeota archaeon]|nr:hypothetical protein [Euryarchaeota archaeon]
MIGSEQVWANAFWLATSALAAATHWMARLLDPENRNTLRRWERGLARGAAAGVAPAAVRPRVLRNMRYSGSFALAGGTALSGILLWDLVAQAATADAPILMATLLSFVSVGAAFMLAVGVGLMRLASHLPTQDENVPGQGDVAT